MNVIAFPCARRSLGHGLVDGVVVRGGEHVGVPEHDLVLTEVALALGRLDVHSCAVAGVADLTQQRFDPAGAEDRVVHVVKTGRTQVAVARAPRVGIARIEHDELQLGAGQCGEPSFGGGAHLPGQDAPRRSSDVGAVRPAEIALDHGRSRQVRKEPDGLQVQYEQHVPVPALPRRRGVAGDGVHIDVHRQQVAAPFGAAIERVIDEIGGMHPFALQAALHVGACHDDRVDLALGDPSFQIVQTEHPVVAWTHRHRVPPEPDRSPLRLSKGSPTVVTCRSAPSLSNGTPSVAASIMSPARGEGRRCRLPLPGCTRPRLRARRSSPRSLAFSAACGCGRRSRRGWFRMGPRQRLKRFHLRVVTGFW